MRYYRTEQLTLHISESAPRWPIRRRARRSGGKAAPVRAKARLWAYSEARRKDFGRILGGFRVGSLVGKVRTAERF